NVGGEAHAEDIEGIDLAGGVSEADQVHRALAIREDGPDGIVRTLAGEIAEKRIARAEREKAQRKALGTCVPGKDAIDNFVRGAVAAHGQKAAIALLVGLMGEFAGMAR